MRAARYTTIVKNPQGQDAVLMLGADYVAEHENGIGEIYNEFGVDPHQIGIVAGVGSRTINRNSNQLQIDEHNIKPTKADIKRGRIGYCGTFLYLSGRENLTPSMDTHIYYFADKIRDDVGNHTDVVDREPMAGAWSNGDFGVFARKPSDKLFLNDLYDAFGTNNVVIWNGMVPESSLRNFGLCIAIKSRLSCDQTEHFRRDDITQANLEMMDNQTGIRTRLQNAGCQWAILKPRVVPVDGDIPTTHPIYYWVSKLDKTTFNAWVTVEILDEWITNCRSD